MKLYTVRPSSGLMGLCFGIEPLHKDRLCPMVFHLGISILRWAFYRILCIASISEGEPAAQQGAQHRAQHWGWETSDMKYGNAGSQRSEGRAQFSLVSVRSPRSRRSAGMSWCHRPHRNSLSHTRQIFFPLIFTLRKNLELTLLIPRITNLPPVLYHLSAVG